MTKKNILITGASGDIGRAIARSLAIEANTMYIHYNQNKSSIDELMAELSDKPCVLKPVQSDLSTETGVSSLLDQIEEDIDLIIHNSGNSFYGLVTDMNEKQVQSMIQLHVTSPFLITQRLLPAMVRKRKGTIIFVSSIWGLTGASCEVLYSMVKGGQIAFVKALAKEVAPSQISVNAVAPGAIETKMLKHFSTEDLEALAQEIPAGRLGKAEEVANAVRFLATDESSYINGQVLSINGAWYC